MSLDMIFLNRKYYKAQGNRFLIAIALAVTLLASFPCSSFSEVQENRIKVAYIYNFAKFINWPQTAFKGDNDPIVIGIYGNNPFADSWDAIRDKRVGERSIVVRDNVAPQVFSNVHILFICESERIRLPHILEKLRNMSVLTVSDMSHFIDQGGMIEMFKDASAIRFKINQEAAKKANISISSKLLTLSKDTKN